jgi:hypothetical protein
MDHRRQQPAAQDPQAPKASRLRRFTTELQFRAVEAAFYSVAFVVLYGSLRAPVALMDALCELPPVVFEFPEKLSRLIRG